MEKSKSGDRVRVPAGPGGGGDVEFGVVSDQEQLVRRMTKAPFDGAEELRRRPRHAPDPITMVRRCGNVHRGEFETGRL